MATSEKGSHPSGAASPQPLAQVQELEPRVARRRLSQARHRATMVGLFNNLRQTVYSQSDLTASKWQVLNKAKNHIQELEQTLDILLKLKESFNLEDGNASSLEEVKEEYARMFSGNDSLIPDSFLQNGSSLWSMEAVGKDAEEEEEEEGGEEEQEQEEEEEEEEDQEEEKKVVTLSPDLLEFERYLTFYKHTMDLLTENGIVSSQEMTLPIVSAAISHVWQTLSEEWKATLLQLWAQEHSGLPGLPGAWLEVACAEGSVKDSGVDSQGASGSLISTPEEQGLKADIFLELKEASGRFPHRAQEPGYACTAQVPANAGSGDKILFEDAFDVASFLNKSEAPSTSSPSSVFANCNPENPEEKFQLYMQIIDFFNGLCCINTQVKQEPALPTDDEMIMLKCLETFDDEDL